MAKLVHSLLIISRISRSSGTEEALKKDHVFSKM